MENGEAASTTATALAAAADGRGVKGFGLADIERRKKKKKAKKTPGFLEISFKNRKTVILIIIFNMQFHPTRTTATGVFFF